MNVLVVTNNPEAGERLEKLGLCVEFTDGECKKKPALCQGLNY